MSLIYFSAAQASYYKGCHFIKGGSQKLSDYLAKVIRDNSGVVQLKHLVIKILTKDKKAVGVEYRKTSGKESEIKSAFAKVIIANTAIPNVANLLQEKENSALNKKIKNMKKACSLISINIGFKREIRELGNKHYSTFVFDESVSNQSDMLNNHKGDFAKRNFAFVDYSQIDSSLAPKGKSSGVVCTADYLSDWNDLNKDDYKKKKEEVAQIFFERLEKVIPGITNEIEYYEVGTPKTIQRYTLNPEGTAYGFAQIPKQSGLFRMSNKSAINNLYFASAWATPGGGFTGAILSGWFCAKEVGQVLRKIKPT
jgi:phytoene dehydrogenase-like protein